MQRAQQDSLENDHWPMEQCLEELVGVISERALLVGMIERFARFN